MSPILGIIASSKAAAAGDFESIATVTVGSGGAANVEFTSIPGTYTHLQIRGLIRCTRSDTAVDVNLQVNSDTGSNYADHALYGSGSAAGAFGGGSADRIRFLWAPAANNTASFFGGAVADMLDYANTNKYKTFRTLTGGDGNATLENQVSLRSGLWQSTSAITSIKLFFSVGNFAQYSHIALYGIRSA
jgi:hypothetical protein